MSFTVLEMHTRIEIMVVMRFYVLEVGKVRMNQLAE